MADTGFVSHSVADTERLGRALGALLRAGDVICLSGPLGAGKTALTRGIAAGWGTREPVTSPTFTLVHEHHRPRNEQVLYHVDCYRLEKPADARTVGLEDMLEGDGVVVLEWPENVLGALPRERLWITMTDRGGSERDIAVEATGRRYDALAMELRESFEDAGAKE